MLPLALLACASLAPTANLVADASFESPLPLWFAPRKATSYFAAKEPVADAPQGRQVLAVEAWDPRGSAILSPVIEWTAEAPSPESLTASLVFRGRGTAPGTFLELALYDEQGARKIATLAKAAPSAEDAWQPLEGKARLEPAPKKFRLALVAGGPAAAGRIEIDLVGLFAGQQARPVADNDDFALVEAESLSDDRGWKAVEHYGGWYTGTPSGMRMLAGGHAVKADDNRPVVFNVAVRHAGKHRLWVRLQTGDHADQFNVALRQKGQTRGHKVFAGTDPRFPRWAWAWDMLEADLEAGPCEAVLGREARGASGHARKIDLFLLTNRLDYTPAVEHFATPGFVRFVNESREQEPFCLHLWVRRHQGPQWYANPGILSRAGLSEGYSVPAAEKRLAPGQASPWARITDYLSAAGGRNNVQVLATRGSHTAGFVEGPIRGRLEFAAGPLRKTVKSIAIDQSAPRILLTLPQDLSQADQIKRAEDYIAEGEAEVARLGPPPASRALELNLVAHLALRRPLDPPDLIGREVAILKGLGFNQTSHPLAPAGEAAEFAAAQGLMPRFGAWPGLWSLVEHRSQFHPDPRAMAARFQQWMAENAPLAPQVVRCKLMDEPSGMSYAEIAASPPCRQAFVAWLQQRQVVPAALGAAGWDDVQPVGPDRRDTHPALFYYSGLFRLQSLPTLARACVRAKNAHGGGHMPAGVNYSPPNSGGSWTLRGTDPFLAHAPGGMEMIWTEDWLGYSVGTEHLSDILALCRAAGRKQGCRLGAYWVCQHSPELVRRKFYTLLAGGVRDLYAYDYGPWYAGIDSWARRFELYAAIRRSNLEAAAIEPFLEGARRRTSPVAILYNRTASIWAHENNAFTTNASFTHWALSHAGYDPQFLAEEDIEEGELQRYRVLYLDGRQLPAACAQRVARWVEQGGVLCGSAGAAACDEFNRPSEVLAAVFGARSAAWSEKASPARPKYELRTLKPLARLDPAGPRAKEAAGLDQLCFHERLEAGADGEVFLEAAGSPAGLLRRHGRGTALRAAALPGVSYLHEALQKPYDPESYRPTAFRSQLRDFIAWPARLAGVTPIARADSPAAEVVRYDGPRGTVLLVVDHAAASGKAFGVELPDAEQVVEARAASGAKVSLERLANGRCRIELPLDACDAVLLRVKQAN